MPYALPAIDGQPTIEEIKEYLENAIASFGDDPPDTIFQRGYQAACEAIYDDLFRTERERAERNR